MIRFACPSCNAVMSAPDDRVGQKGSCPQCSQRVQVPAPIKKTVLGKLVAGSPPVATAWLSDDAALAEPLPQENALAFDIPAGEHYSRTHDRKPDSDGLSVAGLVLGSVALALALMAFVTCGASVFLSLPVAMIGAILSGCSNSKLTTLASVLNVVALLICALVLFMPAIAVIAHRSR